MEILQRDLKLKIDDFGQNLDLDKKIKSYYNLLDDYMIKRETLGVIHTDEFYQPYA